MGAFASQLLSQFSKFLSDLSPAKRLTLLAAALGVFGAMVALILWSGRPDYQVLFANLAPDDAGAIVARLKSHHIPYEIQGDGTLIMVPAKDVYEQRLELAGQGLPQGAGVGFEIFDRTNLGMTDFVQRVNYQRALQGELARTIMEMSEVQQARVNIVLPEKSLFVDRSTRATASVILKLSSGRMLSREQVGAITHLVASSVEGLHPEDITVVDTQGRLLSAPDDGSETGGVSGSRLDYQRELERGLENRVQSMMDRVLGPGKAVARVAVSLNLEQKETTSQKYDPDSQVARSEQRTEEQSSSGTGGNGGIPGVSSNVPGQPKAAAVATSRGEDKRQSSTVNYEINKVVEKTVDPVGTIKRLSVAVLIDGTYGNPQGGSGPGKYIPRTPEEMKKYEEIIKNAVGYNQQRGDQIDVENVAFNDSAMRQDDKAMEAAAKRDFYLSIAKPVAVGIAVLLFFLLIVRPFLGRVKSIFSEGNFQLDLPKTVAQLESAEEEVEVPPLLEKKTQAYRDHVLALAKENPQHTAELIRGWLRDKR